MFEFSIFEAMLHANRLEDAGDYARHYQMGLDHRVLRSLAIAREYWAGKSERDLAALKAAQESK